MLAALTPLIGHVAARRGSTTRRLIAAGPAASKPGVRLIGRLPDAPARHATHPAALRRLLHDVVVTGRSGILLTGERALMDVQEDELRAGRRDLSVDPVVAAADGRAAPARAGRPRRPAAPARGGLARRRPLSGLRPLDHRVPAQGLGAHGRARLRAGAAPRRRAYAPPAPRGGAALRGQRQPGHRARGPRERPRRAALGGLGARITCRRPCPRRPARAPASDSTTRASADSWRASPARSRRSTRRARLRASTSRASPPSTAVSRTPRRSRRASPRPASRAVDFGSCPSSSSSASSAARLVRRAERLGAPQRRLRTPGLRVGALVPTGPGTSPGSRRHAGPRHRAHRDRREIVQEHSDYRWMSDYRIRLDLWSPPTWRLPGLAPQRRAATAPRRRRNNSHLDRDGALGPGRSGPPLTTAGTFLVERTPVQALESAI